MMTPKFQMIARLAAIAAAALAILLAPDGAAAMRPHRMARPKPTAVQLSLQGAVHARPLAAENTLRHWQLESAVAAPRPKYTIATRWVDHKPRFPNNYDAALLHGFGAEAAKAHAQTRPPRRRILVPDDREKSNVLAFAWMCYDAYAMRNDSKGWVDVGGGWNSSDGFGWEKDGVRGYLFADDAQTTIVIAIKGTSATYLGIGGGRTSRRDKLNDNLMFSCCCARVDVTWRPVCDCGSTEPDNPDDPDDPKDPGDGPFRSTAQPTCSSACLQRAANITDSYYHMAQRLFRYVRQTYPAANIWVTGHSLGGALAGLTGLTYDVPAWGYEAPGDLLFAQRLGLVPLHDNEPGALVRHWGNTGDPIFIGECNGPTSSCYYAGYALETRCHIGRTCTYDLAGPPRPTPIPAPQPPDDDPPEPPDDPWGASGNGSWWRRWFDWLHRGPPKRHSVSFHVERVDIRNHRIEKAIEWYFEPWDGVPPCEVDASCRDCGHWNFTE